MITPETKAAMDRVADAAMAEHLATQRRLGRIAAFTVLAIIGGTFAVTLLTILVTLQ